VTEQLANAMIDNGIPEYIRNDNGPEFIAKELLSWLSGNGVKTAYIEPGSPGRMAFAKALMAPLEITFWMKKSFIVLKRPRLSLGSGSITTTI
jgi:putative transposase